MAQRTTNEVVGRLVETVVKYTSYDVINNNVSKGNSE